MPESTPTARTILEITMIEKFDDIVDSHARQIRQEMAKSITEAGRIVYDEIADPAAKGC